MSDTRHEIRAAFDREQASLDDTGTARARLLNRAVPARRRPRRMPLLGGAAAAALGVVVAVGLIAGHVPTLRPAPPAANVPAALSFGPAAQMGASSQHAYVWLTGPVVKPAGQGGGEVTGTQVVVLDWTGRVRHRFQVSQPMVKSLPNSIQSISPDGTRALLNDGSVIDQTGRVVGRLAGLATGQPYTGNTRWTPDDRAVCLAYSHELVLGLALVTNSHVPLPKQAGVTPAPQPTPPYAFPNADHSVTLKLFGLDGTVRTVATVGRGPLGRSGWFPDTVTVPACDPAHDVAVLARYRDADVKPNQQTTNRIVASIWVVRLSNGAVVYQQPETRIATGATYSIAAQDGSLLAEFLWNAKVWGSQTDVVMHLPSGARVPLAAEPIPDIAGVNSDGTRFIRRLVEPNGHTVIELIDSGDGRVVRRVDIPQQVGAQAVAEPHGEGFLIQVDRYLALVDAQGRTTFLGPVPRSGGPGVGLTPLNLP